MAVEVTCFGIVMFLFQYYFVVVWVARCIHIGGIYKKEILLITTKANKAESVDASYYFYSFLGIKNSGIMILLVMVN